MIDLHLHLDGDVYKRQNLPINFNIKMRLVEELSECLKQMGKRIKVSYF